MFFLSKRYQRKGFVISFSGSSKDVEVSYRDSGIYYSYGGCEYFMNSSDVYFPIFSDVTNGVSVSARYLENGWLNSDREIRFEGDVYFVKSKRSLLGNLVVHVGKSDKDLFILRGKNLLEFFDFSIPNNICGEMCFNPDDLLVKEVNCLHVLMYCIEYEDYGWPSSG